jgi:hypothetical protein
MTVSLHYQLYQILRPVWVDASLVRLTGGVFYSFFADLAMKKGPHIEDPLISPGSIYRVLN